MPGLLAAGTTFAICIVILVPSISVVTRHPENIAAGWGAVAGGVLLYATACEALLTHKAIRKFFIGFERYNAGNNEPVYLPWAAAFWSATSAACFGIWHIYAAEDAPAHKQIGQKFFTAGWNQGLTVVGVAVDSWSIYLAIVLYQLTRAIMGSLVKMIFLPFYNRVISSCTVPDATTRARLLRGNKLVELFSWWSSLTDVLISAAQLDLALCVLAASLAADHAQIVYRYSEMEDAPEKPTMMVILRQLRVP